MAPDPQILLASKSPQRHAILEQIGFQFRSIDPDIDEVEVGDPKVLVVTNALAKAQQALSERRDDEIIVGVDTTVDLDGTSIGKPIDEADARNMLLRLRGKSHTVHSGVAVIVGDQELVNGASTRVTFREFSDIELDAYLGSGEWRERAGAYAIQGRGARLVADTDGCFYNVVGFPIAAFLDLLKR